MHGWSSCLGALGAEIFKHAGIILHTSVEQFWGGQLTILRVILGTWQEYFYTTLYCWKTAHAGVMAKQLVFQPIHVISVLSRYDAGRSDYARVDAT